MAPIHLYVYMHLLYQEGSGRSTIFTLVSRRKLRSSEIILHTSTSYVSTWFLAISHESDTSCFHPKQSPKASPNGSALASYRERLQTVANIVHSGLHGTLFNARLSSLWLKRVVPTCTVPSVWQGRCVCEKSGDLLALMFFLIMF